jgi:predicted RNA-binding Zn-ribbon protein involved in translation (DUF1610 family)
MRIDSITLRWRRQPMNNLTLGCCGVPAEIRVIDDGAALLWKCPKCGNTVVTKRQVLGEGEKKGE